MERYLGISSVCFGQTALGLPLSVRVSRQGQVEAAGGDADLYATSVQLARPVVSVEIRTRDTAAAESLVLAQKADLSWQIGPTEGGSNARQAVLSGAVLVGIEVACEQNAPAVATLRFVAEAPEGLCDPFSCQEVS